MNELERKAFAEKRRFDIADLVEIMAVLRSDGGCPWDREQTHKSIRNDFIEEVYEAVEAIDTDDMTLMREELGDVLLQVVFHSRIAQEDGAFDFADVVSDVCAKLVVRHPHVFGEVEADTAEKVLINWDKIKQSTKGRKNVAEALEGVSKSLPSLMRAGKLAKKSAKAELYELPIDDESMSAEEIGKKLFELSAQAEKIGVNAEEALSEYCNRFINEMTEREKTRK